MPPPRREKGTESRPLQDKEDVAGKDGEEEDKEQVVVKMKNRTTNLNLSNYVKFDLQGYSYLSVVYAGDYTDDL